MSTTVSIRPPKPKPLNIDEVRAALRRESPGLKVYNPSSDWLNPEIHGRTNIWLCPDLGGSIEPNPATGAPTVCNGVSEVKGRFLSQRDSSGKVIEGQDAESAVGVLMTHMSEMGVIYLPGRDEAEDAEFKQWARDQYRSYQWQADQEVVDRRKSFEANWKKAHPGEGVPPPTDVEMGAYDRLAETRRVKSYKYTCDAAGCIGYVQNDWARFAKHLQTAHGITADRSRYDAAVSGLGPSVVAAPVPESGIAEAAEAFERKTRKART